MKLMKIFKSRALLSIIILSLTMITCSDNNLDDDNSSDTNNLTTGQIEMKGYPDTNNTVTFFARAKKITVDWGDGTVEEFAPQTVEVVIKLFHKYLTQNLQTVKVNTEEMTYIGIGNVLLYELRFGNCPDLKDINCYRMPMYVLEIKKAESLTNLVCCDCELASLDLSKCPTLKNLDCSNNNLDALALNALFNSLPTLPTINTDNDWIMITIHDSHGSIDISGNPGGRDCDKTIAQKKGWNI
jgi:Leucine-rich repeat (LRR) protein